MVAVFEKWLPDTAYETKRTAVNSPKRWLITYRGLGYR